MNVFLFSLITLLSTAAGGLCGFRLTQRLHLVLGFTAGALLGVVCFDLLPEVFELSHRAGGDGRAAMVALVAGFLVFHGLETFVRVHAAREAGYLPHRHPHVGVLSALAMIVTALPMASAWASRSRSRRRPASPWRWR